MNCQSGRLASERERPLHVSWRVGGCQVVLALVGVSIFLVYALTCAGYKVAELRGLFCISCTVAVGQSLHVIGF